MNSPLRANPNFPRRSVSPEQDTGRRYNLHYDLLNNSDRLINHPSGASRIVTYLKGGPEAESIKDKLIDMALILGYPIGSGLEEEQIFVVPPSARPLAYDSGSQTEGSYSYNDTKLFYDLGNMLAQ